VGEQLHIWIADSGSGQNTQSDSGSGVGLQNIRERLRMRYGDRASLSTEQADLGGLEALLQMPLDNTQ
jgi:LytS/YehU family sensor histidine kinase